MRFNFTTTKKLYAEVRNMLDSYFAVGAVNDILFDTWVKTEINKLGVTVKKKKSGIVNVSNHKGILPSDFDLMFDVWSCEGTDTKIYKDPSYIYYQEDYEFEDQCVDKCSACQNNMPSQCSCVENHPECRIVHRVTGSTEVTFKRKVRVLPGDVYTINSCDGSCPLVYKTYDDYPYTFQVDGCNLVTTIKNGIFNIIYYQKNIDKDGNMLIPEDTYIHLYLFNTLMYRCYEKLLNSTHDETYNQVVNKLQYYEKQKKDSWLNLMSKLKMPSKEKILKANQREKTKFNRFKRRYY